MVEPRWLHSCYEQPFPSKELHEKDSRAQSCRSVVEIEFHDLEDAFARMACNPVNSYEDLGHR